MPRTIHLTMTNVRQRSSLSKRGHVTAIDLTRLWAITQETQCAIIVTVKREAVSQGAHVTASSALQRAHDHWHDLGLHAGLRVATDDSP